MRLIYMAARLYPYWAVALIIVGVQLGIYFRRLRHPFQWFFWVVIVVLVIGILAWFGFRGDKNTDVWLRTIGLTY